MIIELLPCPFCKDGPYGVELISHHKFGYEIHCDDCGIHFHINEKQNKEKIIEAWNNRDKDKSVSDWHYGNPYEN
tara:strand:- start:9955 stop:10179 length:225 start_codon:yes stop_codon:yes gene_type:complete